MKYFACLILIIFLSNCNSKIHSAQDFYSSGQPKYQGKYIECQTNDPTYPQVIVNEKRKFGEWRSFYPNGNLKEIRHYTEKVNDCQTDVLKEGLWKYYNRNETLYLTEQYSNDSLIFSEFDIYEGMSLIGKVIKRDFAADSVILNTNQNTSQFISNSSFERYFFKPIFLTNDGFDQIESLIPGWYSPDKATPDYYNTFRTIQGVPPHFQSSDQALGGHVGLMLYLGEQKDQYFIPSDYTETIQTKLLNPLQKDEIYCLKIRIRLSENSGFSINKLGVLFSEEAITFENTKSLDSASISFAHDWVDQSNWVTLCEDYQALGDESYLSIGRFTSLNNLISRSHSFKYESALNINESAYYLLDKIELNRVNDRMECSCETSTNLAELEPDIDLSKFTVGDTLILNSILFEFDSHKLNPSSLQELGQLAEYMQDSPEVTIEITGHTDDVGSDEYNLELSKERANEVAKYLMENGIRQERIKTIGAGNKYPFDLNQANSHANRRVEIILTLLTKADDNKR